MSNKELLTEELKSQATLASIDETATEDTSLGLGADDKAMAGDRMGKGRPGKAKGEMKGTFKFIFGTVLAKYKIQLAIVALCVLMSAVTTVLGTSFMQPLIDTYISPFIGDASHDYSSLITALLVMASVYLVGIMSSITYTQIMVYISQKSLKNIRDTMFVKLQNLPISYYDTSNNGEVMSYFSNDTDTLLHMIAQGVPQLINTTFTVSAILVAMFVINPILAGMTVFYAIGMLLVAKTLGKASAKNFRGQQESISKINSYVEEMISGQKIVKVFNHEEKCKEDFAVISDAWRVSGFKAVRLAVSVGPIITGLGHLLYVLVAIIGGIFAINGIGNTTIGGIVSFLLLAKMFVSPIMQAAEQINNIAMASAGSERIEKLLKEIDEVDNGYVTLVKADKSSGEYQEIVQENDHTSGEWCWKHPHGDGTTTYHKLVGHVELDHVDFGYVPEKLVLHDVTMTASPGEKIALVGSTGAGKTTITNLINRFYDIDDGKIRYDGININKIKKESLRKSLGVVLQDVNLFTGTIADNIRYGRHDATDEEVFDAAKRANAHDFISVMPEGYNTIIDGDGNGLSQGQRQLLSISRAIIADTPLMILDEATSSIDTRTEVLVQQGMDALMQGRTCFVIAHRLSTIQNSDCIMVLEKGVIIERGNHEALLAKNGRYAQLHSGAEAIVD